MARAPSAEFLREAIFLVDASSYIFRAYYAMPPGLAAPDGTPTHATFGFLQMIQSLLEIHSVGRCALIWDRKEKGFRHKIFPEYKANRTVPPEDLGLQIENAKEGSRRLGFPQLESPGFEADDIMATLVRRFPSQPFVIVTADKDLLQLVGPKVWCLDTLKKKWSNEPEAVEKFGVPPEKIPHVQAICGDAVDNIPGVKGVGPKGATELISHFGDLEAVLAEAAKGKPSGPLKGKKLEAVARDAEQARLSLRLVSLRDNVPIETTLGDLTRSTIDETNFREWARSLGFGKMIDRLLQTPGASVARSGGPSSAAPVEARVAADFRPSAMAATSFDFKTIDSLEAFQHLLEAKSREKRVCVDTETRSPNARESEGLVGLSLAFDDKTGYYLPLRHVDGPSIDVGGAVRKLERFLDGDAREAVIFQNGKFDLHALGTEGFRFPRPEILHDTMVQSFVLDPAASHGMDALSKKWLGYRPQSFNEALRGRKDFSEVPVDLATRYAAEDAVVTWALFDKLSTALKAEKLWDIYNLLDRPLVTILFEMEDAGIRLDAAPLKTASEELRHELESLELQARKSLEESGVGVEAEFNFGSPKQVAAVLFEKLKLPVLKKTKTGPSTDVSVLEELASSHPFPKYLLEIRELSKLLSTYVEALPQLIDPRTGRLHTDYSQTVAVTGRLSSSNPNLQNIPIRTDRGRKLRDAFRASDGQVLVSVDYSQIELRLLAQISRDDELLRAFRENADIHRRTAALVMGMSEELVTSDARRMAKTINFGIIYGQSAFGLAKTLGIPRTTAQKFIDGYFQTYPGIRAYMDRAIEEARNKGFVSTLVGRRRPVPEIHSKNPALRGFGERTAINSPIQGTAADLMKAAMIAVRQRVLPEFPEARLLLQVHDELLLEVPEGQGESLRDAVVRTLEDPELLAPLGLAAFDVPMKADSAIGTDWGKL